MKNCVYLDKENEQFYKDIANSLGIPLSQYLRLLLLEPKVQDLALKLSGHSKPVFDYSMLGDKIVEAVSQKLLGQLSIDDLMKGDEDNNETK